MHAGGYCDTLSNSLTPLLAHTLARFTIFITSASADRNDLKQSVWASRLHIPFLLPGISVVVNWLFTIIRNLKRWWNGISAEVLQRQKKQQSAIQHAHKMNILLPYIADTVSLG